MKRIIFLFLIACNISCIAWGQDVLDIIDSVNAKIINNCASFSYDVKVENVKDSITELLDKGNLKVNNTHGKYDDFLFISHHKNDTFCFVKDTLLKTISDEIRKDFDPQALHVRLGTSKMFFRCFSSSFRNEKKLINPERWDNMTLDSIDSEFYYLTLHGTMTMFEIFNIIKVNVVVDKNSFHICKYYDQIESSTGDLINTIFTFSNWESSPKINEDVYSIFEKIRQRSNSQEYLSKHPTRKMRTDHNKTLSLDDLSIIDSLDVTQRLRYINKRYVVLYFWFQGCIHCRHVGPVIQKFYKMNSREDITFLGVDVTSKNKQSLLQSVQRNQYEFPNYRYNEGVKELTVNGAPMVIIYDNIENKILEQFLGGNKDFENKFSKFIDALPRD